MIDRGSYRARATAYKLVLCDTGIDQVVVTFAIREPGEFRGQAIDWVGSFASASEERTLRALRTCGWDGTDRWDLDGFDRNEVALVIEHEECGGVAQACVRWVNRLGAARVEMTRKMTDTQKAVFAARLKVHAVPITPKVSAEPGLRGESAST
jgi:hypothetical protein